MPPLDLDLGLKITRCDFFWGNHSRIQLEFRTFQSTFRCLRVFNLVVGYKSIRMNKQLQRFLEFKTSQFYKLTYLYICITPISPPVIEMSEALFHAYQFQIPIKVKNESET